MRILVALLLTMGLPGSPADNTYSTEWTKQFGGSDFDGVTAIATDPDGNVYVAGSTLSVDLPANGAFRLPTSSNLRRVSAGANRVDVVRGPVGGEVLAMTTSGEALYVATRSGIMLTQDRGSTWQVLDTNIARHGLVTGIAVEPSNPAVIYVAAQTGGFWKTLDAGKTWTPLSQGREFQGQTTSVNRVYIDPRRPSTVYAIGGSYDVAFRSDDAGTTWARLPDSVRSIAFDTQQADVVYASQRDTVLISEDRGQAWKELASPGAGWIEELIADPMRPGTLYLSSGAALYRSPDRGRTWVRLALPPGSLAPDPASLALYVFATGSLLKTIDAGDSWTTITRDVSFSGSSGAVLAVLPGSVFIGGAHEQESFVAKLSSGGSLVWATYVPAASVSAIAAGKDDSVYIAGFCSTTLAALGGLPCSVYASTYVAKFTADGQKLAYAKEFSPNAYITSVAVDSAGNAHIAGTASGVIPTTPGALGPDPGDIPPLLFESTPNLGFAAKFETNGKELIYSTYLGDWRALYPWSSRSGDSVSSIVVDRAGNAIAVGTAIWKINPTGTGLLYSTRLDGPLGAASMDPADNLYVAGSGIGKRVYTTRGAFRTDGGDKEEVFVAKLSPSGDILVATLVGQGWATDLAVGPDGSVLVGGRMADRQFPKKSLLEAEGIGFVAQFDTALSALQFSTPVDLGTASKMGIVPQHDAGLVIATTVTNPPSNLGQSPDSDVVLRGIKPVDSPVRVDLLANAASLAAAPLAPGELIVILGHGFGTAPRVTAGAIEFSVVQSSDTVLWAMVPDNVQTGTQQQLTVEANGSRSEDVRVRFVDFALGVFTADGSGEGQALALNEDGTLNAAMNPAARGSIIGIALNGLGKLQEIGSSVVPGFQLSVYFEHIYAYGVDANLLPLPGIPAEVVFVKVYVPKDGFFPQSFPRSVALGVYPQVGGTVNSLSVWIK